MNSLEFQNFIDKQLENEKILHSYMFYGENIEDYQEQILLFLYSTITKKNIFKEYNITKPEDSNIIKEKENLYNQILSGTIEEFKILDGKEMKVQDIRNAFSSVYEKPLIIEKRIYIISNFEYLNNSSQNALLKILEEPPFYATYSETITKENIEEILNILENLIYENSMIYNRLYKNIIETRRRLRINCNFEMIKDYLILSIWDEMN